MIYFDNSSTTLIKPPSVAEAVAHAINNFGNAGRSFYAAAHLANREIYNTRAEIAQLIGLQDPLNVAFTASATESLNLVIGGLIGRSDHVIATIFEHNSVLRPLYLTGCSLSFAHSDDIEGLITPATKFLVATHGSNLTGEIFDAEKLYKTCKKHNIIMILDISQTFGVVPVNINMADIFCFTGHKGLFGPQGTGGIITNGNSFNFKIIKTGGAGVHTFENFQSTDIPDIFETGTANAHGIYGLQAGVKFINEIGVDKIYNKESKLLEIFYNGIKNIDGIEIYGNFDNLHNRLPIISLNLRGLTSAELAEILWENYGIATRAGGHCAPLLHKNFNTIDRGMVRFSFSYFNTTAEILQGVEALHGIYNNL